MEYTARLFCRRCRRPTRHLVCRGEPGPDSVGDLFVCKACRWWRSGPDPRYAPPLDLDP